jgi:hypothetical protein
MRVRIGGEGGLGGSVRSHRGRLAGAGAPPCGGLVTVQPPPPSAQAPGLHPEWGGGGGTGVDKGVGGRHAVAPPLQSAAAAEH